MQNVLGDQNFTENLYTKTV